MAFHIFFRDFFFVVLFIKLTKNVGEGEVSEIDFFFHFVEHNIYLETRQLICARLTKQLYTYNNKVINKLQLTFLNFFFNGVSFNYVPFTVYNR